MVRTFAPGAQGRNPPDDPGPAAGGGLVVRCPRGPIPLRAGYAIYAVRFDVEEPDDPDAIVESVQMSAHVGTIQEARAMCADFARRPTAHGIGHLGAVIVQTHGGERKFVRDMEPAAA